MEVYLKIYIVGISILLVAVFLNFLAIKLGINTWYSFLDDFKEKGFSSLNFFDYLFLFLIYPFLLGFIAFNVLKYLS